VAKEEGKKVTKGSDGQRALLGAAK